MTSCAGDCLLRPMSSWLRYLGLCIHNKGRYCAYCYSSSVSTLVLDINSCIVLANGQISWSNRAKEGGDDETAHLKLARSRRQMLMTPDFSHGYDAIMHTTRSIQDYYMLLIYDCYRVKCLFPINKFFSSSRFVMSEVGVST